MDFFLRTSLDHPIMNITAFFVLQVWLTSFIILFYCSVSASWENL